MCINITRLNNGKRNAFILPYNKELEIFKNDQNIIRCINDDLVYFGFANVDWRTDKEDYDYIHTFGIDFNFLLRNYNSAETDKIVELCDIIESEVEELKNNRHVCYQ